MDAGFTDAALNPDAEPKRIAFVASYAPSLTLFRGSLIRKIISLGHSLACVAPDFDQTTETQLVDWGAEPHRVPLSRTGLNPLADLASARALLRLFRAWSPDVVMGYTPKPAIYASLAARKAGVPHIVPMITGLGYAYLEGGGIKRTIVRAITTRLYARALAASHGVIFHNRDDAQLLSDLAIVPDDLAVTITRGSGVDLDHYAHAPLPPLEGGVTFLMIARLVRYKGVAEYCAAARILKERGIKARCLLVGPPEAGPAGYPVSELERHADAVSWLGPSDDVRRHLKDTHVYVLPSYGEGMPRTVLEALATGRAIITTDTRGCRETVSEGVNGLLVPVGDAKALADAMERMASQPEEIASMAAESRKLAEAEFDVAGVNATMLEALDLDERITA
ncbi:MAG: glycosyltransferase family 4 protein [Hyphomicrobiales bacterium]|nr:glycosyltransferase family 4 protein [Hyphomicrobiales bacterium]